MYCEGTDCLTATRGIQSLVPIHIYVTCRKTSRLRGCNFRFHKVRAIQATVRRVGDFSRVEHVPRPTTVCPWYTITVSGRWKQTGTGSVVFRCSLRFACCTITYLRLLCSAAGLWRESSYSSTLTATSVSYYLDAINIWGKPEFGRRNYIYIIYIYIYIYIYIFIYIHTHTHIYRV